MMDQLLERDATGTDQIIADCRCRDQMGPVVDSVVDDTQHDSQVSEFNINQVGEIRVSFVKSNTNVLAFSTDVISKRVSV